MIEQINFLLLKDKEIASYRDEIAKLRIEIFRDFPYLYDGDFEYEKKYLKVYEESQREPSRSRNAWSRANRRIDCTAFVGRE